MRIPLKSTQNVYNLMRQLGYRLQKTGEEKEGEASFVRQLSGAGYPRFHAYVSRETSELNLHLDQKKPIYRGSSAHSAEYEGELVQQEAERIQKLLD